MHVLGTVASLSRFAGYFLYSQAHCLWLTVKAVVTGEAVTLDVTRPLTETLQVACGHTRPRARAAVPVCALTCVSWCGGGVGGRRASAARPTRRYPSWATSCSCATTAAGPTFSSTRS
jgi:hypothetical protein